MSQVKSEFNKGNNLRAYLGCAPGVPSSGTIKLTDLLGKDAWRYYMGYPFSKSYFDAGYHYTFVSTDYGRYWTSSTSHPEIPSATHLDQYYPSDNWGFNTDYSYYSYEVAIVNCGDIASQLNAFPYFWWAASDSGGYFSSRWLDMSTSTLGSTSYWTYSNAVGSNGTFCINSSSTKFRDNIQLWGYYIETDNTYAAMRFK